ncbi:N-acetylglucosamine-6-phosphate deacetylase [Streptomyces sp. NPDC005799]|uniref:N-acetylglucosamine-6-phosphate deacetylase n=1 Tax=Streptomyces sp. NPDC005799 TaxID=3154678 RepID=UPI0033FC0B4A
MTALNPTPTLLHLTNARVVTPDQVLEPGWLTVYGSRIKALGSGRPPFDQYAEVIDLGGHWVFPGFIDLHVHGGAGASFNSADPDEIRAAAAFHHQHGTTRTLASLVTDSPDSTAAALKAIAQVQAEGPGLHGHLEGAHLEGPFLSPERPGCHNIPELRPPDPAYFLELYQTVGPGVIRMITLAPELSGGLDLIETVTAHGAVAAVGHSTADLETVTRAFDLGARVVTHLHNAMPNLHHRRPGIIGAAFADPRATAELIADGVHVHDNVVALTFAAAPGRIALVTDAAPAAGTEPGHHSRIGAMPTLTRPGGLITVPDSDTLAGSSLTMDAAVSRCMSLGIDPSRAAHAAATLPARILGIAHEVGSLVPGHVADLAILDDTGRCHATVLAGRLVEHHGRQAPTA